MVEHAGLDFFVIRGTAVSAQHVSNSVEPLDLARFIYELDVPVIVGGCATYQHDPASDAYWRSRCVGRFRWCCQQHERPGARH